VEGDQIKLKQVKKPSPSFRTSQKNWARSSVDKAHTFTKHLADDLQPHPSEKEPEEEEALFELLENPYQLEPPINHLKRAEAQVLISSLNPKIS
jgi:hypothetical protein